MATLAILLEENQEIDVLDTTLLVRHVKRHSNPLTEERGLYEIWGVSDNGTVSHFNKPIPLNAVDLPDNGVFNLEDIDCEYE